MLIKASEIEVRFEDFPSQSSKKMVTLFHKGKELIGSACAVDIESPRDIMEYGVAVEELQESDNRIEEGGVALAIVESVETNRKETTAEDICNVPDRTKVVREDVQNGTIDFLQNGNWDYFYPVEHFEEDSQVIIHLRYLSEKAWFTQVHLMDLLDIIRPDAKIG